MIGVATSAFVALALTAIPYPLTVQNVAGTLAPEGDVSAAATAFGEAQRAALAGDPARAAEFYELADSIVPSPEALRSAAKSRRAAGQLTKAAMHAEVLRRLYEDPISLEVAAEILTEAETELVRLQVTCDYPCSVASDGKALSLAPANVHILYVDPGSHTIHASFAGRPTIERALDAGAGEQLPLSFEAPAAPRDEAAAPDADRAASSDNTTTGVATETDEPRNDRSRRISPAFFTVGAIASLGLGGATVWSGIDVLGKNDNYKTDPTKAGYDQGSRAELRTNVLIGATAAVGITTILFAVFTDWSRWSRRPRKDATSVAVTPSLTRPGLVLVGRFGL